MYNIYVVLPVIDPDEAEGLLLNHITTHGELNRWEQDNIVEVLAWIDKAKPANILKEQFVKKLHKRIFGNVWRWTRCGSSALF